MVESELRSSWLQAHYLLSHIPFPSFFWLSALIENDYNFEGLFLIIYLICLYVTVLKNNYLLYC